MARKEDILAADIAEAVGAGREVEVETVDFSDPDRPKTCLEVDFPMLPINEVAAIEGNAGKPIYQMSKWWARRRSSVFRAMLIAGAMKAPEADEAAKAVWDVYYANHQKNDSFKHLKVADIFMGGGTTIVEGARLGMQMYGVDLNPVAWLVVKNEVADVDAEEVKALLNEIEAEVKPQIMPFYACDCPRGHKGKWTRKSTGQTMDEAFDPFSLTPEERKGYAYEGPEIIYTFWAKHGPCSAKGCGHRTPIMTSPVVAVKTLTVKAWIGRKCTGCGEEFDIEQQDARMAPGTPLVVSSDEQPYAVMDKYGRYSCPHCAKEFKDAAAALNDTSVNLGKAKNKSVSLTLLVHPGWLKGSPAKAPDGTEYGGSVTDSIEATAAWYRKRAETLRFVEVRGKLPIEITCPETGVTFRTDGAGGTVPKKSTFTCQAPTCGREHDVLQAIKASGKTGPVSVYAIQGYCPDCDKEKRPYSGRFFAPMHDVSSLIAAAYEWSSRKDGELDPYWPKSELPYGFMTHHLNGGIPNHGFTHWWKMFNPRQLLVMTQLLRSIMSASSYSQDVTDYLLGAFEQYLRNQNMFSFWNTAADKMEPMFSNNNYHPKSTTIENCVFAELGRGNWRSCTEGILEGLEWCDSPWELVARRNLERTAPDLAKQISAGSAKTYLRDAVMNTAELACGSATQVSGIADGSLDLVITDPPFGGLLHYSELSDFFYVWLRLALRNRYPDWFSAEYVPKALEAVANKARHPEDPDAFYQRLLTECWKEAHRILKPSGMLAFTFHHSEDEPWVAVLESLFDAGFYLEATFPIRSDETKGEGEFGSRKVEYDIIHVCRKRNGATESISWARLRRQIVQDVKQLKDLLEQHQASGLPEADLQVIRRGKALEYFSRHYGKVYVEKDRPFGIQEALVGINQLLDDESDATLDAPPVTAEPYTRQFLRMFADSTEVPRDQMQKYLRGTGIAPSEFEAREWCSEVRKVYYMTPPLELARKWKGLSRRGMARDFDQTMFLVGACFPDSGIRVDDTLNSPNFKPHPATADLLDWMTRHGGTFEIKQAAQLAKQLYSSWQSKNKAKVKEQMELFDLTNGEG